MLTNNVCASTAKLIIKQLALDPVLTEGCFSTDVALYQARDPIHVLRAMVYATGSFNEDAPSSAKPPQSHSHPQNICMM